MVDEWRQLSFSQAVHINPRVRLQREESYPFVDMASVSPENRSVQPKGIRAYKGGGSRFIAGDTLMARITPCLENGKIARYAPDQTDIAIQAHGSTEFYVIRGRDKVSDNDFAYHLARSEEVRNYAISQMSGTSGRQRVPKDCFDHLIIALPSLPEQRAIAHILGTLDDKIELNRRMNETLEAIARALFKSWFVDFDPVRAKMAGRDTGLPPEIAALFPDRLVPSELGEIPAGWQVGKLSDIAISPRRSIDPNSIREDTPYIGLEHMPRRSISLESWEYSEKVSSNKSVFRKGEFLFGKLRPYFHKVGIAPLNGICSTDIVVIAPKCEFYSSFVLSLISSDDFVSYTDQTSTGTKMPRTSWKTMSRFPVCKPEETVFQAFERVIGSNLKRVTENVHGNCTLADMRDALLPKLISGELRLRDAESFLERAL